VCLADGLGHGHAAREAAEAACRHAREHAGAPLDTLMRGIDGALAGLRGAAVSLLSIDEGTSRVRFVGVGNVELRAVACAPIAPPNFPGIVGQRMRSPRIWEYPIAVGDVLVLFSDGISSRFELGALAHLAPQVLADAILASHGKSHDDASAVVVHVVGDAS